MTAPAVKVARKPQIRPRLRQALDLLVNGGHTIAGAAEIAGMTYESLRVALQRPHVQEAMTALKRERLGLESLRSFHKVTELRDNAASEKVQLESAKVILTAAGELEPERHQGPGSGVMVQIVVNSDKLAAMSASGGVIKAPAWSPPLTPPARQDPHLMLVGDDDPEG